MVNPMMKRTVLFLLIALSTLALVIPAAQAKLTAQVDRDQLSPDETLTLTLSRDSGSAFSSVDLQPLEKDFTVVGRSQSSNTQFINGSVSSSFSLLLSLAPKRNGVLTIPPLSVGGESSEPLTVKVLSQPQPKTRTENAAIFLESEMDTHAVGVQEQVLLTLRIYVAVQAQIAEPEPPQVADALVEKLTDARFTKSVNGRSYEVFERKFAIFPQKSGVLEVPPLRVRATVPAQSAPRNDFFGGFFGAMQKEVNLASNPERITVREKVADYPAGAAWLPSGKLTAAVAWSREPNQLKVGDSATVTITLAAQGLLAAQLPPIAYPDTEGLKIYQGKGELQNLPKADGVTGVRKESVALIPTRPGAILLPEIRIPWWNKNSHKVEYAIIPAQRLVAKGSALAAPPGGMISAPGGSPAIPELAAPGAEVSSVVPTAARFPALLAILAVALLLGWLVTLYLLLKTRHQLAAVRAGEGGRQETGLAKEREAFRLLADACRSNDPGLARKAFWNWAKVFGAGKNVRTSSDLERIFPGGGLLVLLEEMDRNLYAEVASGWQGQGLLTAVASLRKVAAKNDQSNSPLPPLYR